MSSPGIPGPQAGEDVKPWRVACISRALDDCQIGEVREDKAAADLRLYYGQDPSGSVSLDDSEDLAVMAKLSWLPTGRH